MPLNTSVSFELFGFHHVQIIFVTAPSALEEGGKEIAQMGDWTKTVSGSASPATVPVLVLKASHPKRPLSLKQTWWPYATEVGWCECLRDLDFYFCLLAEQVDSFHIHSTLLVTDKFAIMLIEILAELKSWIEYVEWGRGIGCACRR